MSEELQPSQSLESAKSESSADQSSSDAPKNIDNAPKLESVVVDVDPRETYRLYKGRFTGLVSLVSWHY